MIIDRRMGWTASAHKEEIGMNRHLWICVLLLLFAGTAQATNPPSISAVGVPYPSLSTPLRIRGVIYSTGIVPYGPVGTPVTITGSNFGTNVGTVTFRATQNGAVTASVITWTDTKVTLTVPSGAVTGGVAVTVAGQSSNASPFIVTPGSYGANCPTTIYTPTTILTASLPNGAPNKAYSATLSASGGTAPYNWSVVAGSLPDGVSLTASTGAVSGRPTSTSSATITFQVADSYWYTATKSLSIVIVANPHINSISPTSGLAGTLVTLQGTGFGDVQGDSILAFGGVATPAAQWSDTALGFYVPYQASSGSVTVTVAGVTSNSLGFTVSGSLSCPAN